MTEKDDTINEKKEEQLMLDFFGTVQYDKTKPWQKTPETEEDPDE